MPKAIARLATSEPMRPRPITPSVLPWSSMPSLASSLRNHLPLERPAAACGTLRASAIMRPNANSAVVTMLPSGVFMTTTPCCVASSTFTLSTPTPARPTTFNCFAAAMTFFVTFVSERTSNAVASPTMAHNSSSVWVFSRTTTLNSGRCFSSSMPLGEIGSQTMIFIKSKNGRRV